MTKKILFLLTFLLTTLGGGNLALAAEYTVMFDNGATQSTPGWFTVTGVDSYQSAYHGTYGGHTYTKGAKIGSTANISFTTTVMSDVTIVQCISRDEPNKPLRFDGTALQENQITAMEDGIFIEYTVTNVAAGLHSITRGDSQTGLFFIKVTENVFTMEVNENDLFYGNAAYVGTTFPYVSGVSSFRIKLNFNMTLASSDKTTSHFTVTSTNSGVINVSSYSVGAVDGQDDRLYYYVDVVGEGTATLTFNYDGTGSRTNAASCSKTFTITAPTFTAFNPSSPTYPYTWDFANNDWTSSKIQTKNDATNWNYLDNEARPKSGVSSIAAANGIDMINGLSFSANIYSPCLDWTSKLLWLQAGTTITLPSLNEGQIITLSSTGSFATPAGTTKVGNNVFRVISNSTVVTLTVPSGDCYLYSVAISSAGQATYETTSDGVFQFTGTGNLDGGTVIKDVPGIEMQIGYANNTYNVGNARENNNDHLANSVGCEAIMFIPKVNGFLTVNVYSTQNSIFVDQDATGTSHYAQIYKDFPKNEELTTPLLAGHTYILNRETVYLHSFSYRPAFLTTDNTAEQTAIYEVYPSETTFPMIVNASTSGVTFSSGATGVATVEEYGNGWPTYVSTGSTVITATVASPNSAVSSKPASYTLKFKAADITPTLAFANPEPSAVDYIYYGDDMSEHSTFTNAIVSTVPEAAFTGATFTYTSSDTSIATVDASGNLSIFNNGTVTITATMAAHDEYLQATQTYELTIKPTEASVMSLEHNSTAEDPIVIPFGNGYTNKGTVYRGGVAHPEADILYSPEYVSGSTALLTTNNEKGIVTPDEMDDTDEKNVVAIRVHSDAYKQYREATATYYVKIVQNTNLSLKFAPINRGNVNVDASITPYLGIGSVKGDKIGSLTATFNDACATGTTDLKTNWELNPDGTVFKLNPVMTGVSTGIATITYTLEDTKYYQGTTATYHLTVNASGTRNFRWKDNKEGEPEYKVFQGDFMLMPLIDGNSNANNSYSNHSNNKYLYQVSPKNSSPSSISNFTLKYNDNDYRLNEGIPDFEIRNADKSAVSDKAVIFLGKGEGGRTGEKPDTLLIYALPIGGSEEQTVYIRAYEPANHSIFCDAKLTIMPKTTLTAAYNADVNAVTYPYTWDFTKNFDESVINKIASDNVYWTPNGSDAYNIGGGFFNINSYAKPNDKTIDSKNTSLYYQNFVADGATIPQFKGMMVSINGTSSWGNKVGRLQISPTAGDGNSHVFFNGGYHELMLPDVSTSNIAPDNYKVFIKVKSNGSGKVTCIQGSSSVEKTFGSSSPSILSFDATKTGGQVILRLNNAHVYWIAMSTEAKSIGTAAGGSDHMASYSYSQTMDYSKSHEANNVDAYVATAVTKVTNEGSSSNPALKVTLVNSNNRVPSGTGVVLKATAAKNAYMIADARNEETYEDPSAPTGNLLIGTGKTGCTIYELASNKEGTVSGSSFVPFYFSSKFRDYSVASGIGEQQNAGYYAFWRVYGSQSMPANYSYMVLDADKFKDTYGKPANINDGAASRIMLAFDDSDDDSGTTGVNSINNTLIDSDAWYTLQGVRVNAPTKSGIYIHKGKKVVVK